MNEKNIIKKLGELKGIGPQKAWKEKTRSFLLSEVRSSVFEIEKPTIFTRIFALPKFALGAVEEKAWAVGLIVIVLVGGGFGAQAASKNARPGDSLYLARVFSERAKVAVTFDKEKKAKLDMQLASDRAKEITEVLAELSTGENGDGKKAARLSESFKEEIKIVKKNIKEMEQIRETAAPEKNIEPGVASGTSPEEASFGIGAPDPKIKVVEAGKDKQGMDIYIPTGETIAAEEAKVASGEEATSSEEVVVPEEVIVHSTTTEENVNSILSDAQDSVEANDFASAKVMLETVDQIINGQPAVEEEGAVKGVATTSEERVANVATSTEK